jgi:creatinine amidohydrolase
LGRVDREHAIPILPVGAVEAHGPHLPLFTDVIIAEAMAVEAVSMLSVRGIRGLVLPPISYTAAPFARGFPGTISIQPQTVTRIIEDISMSLFEQGFRRLAIANAHLDPTHTGSIKAAVDSLQERGGIRVIYPDVTRKPWAVRLTEEFKSGACHAGQYEGSIVMAARPDLVKREIQRSLPENPTSLSVAIKEGKDRFEEIGGDRAYFGDPASATAKEGHETIKVLGQILVDAIIEAGRERPETGRE